MDSMTKTAGRLLKIAEGGLHSARSANPLTISVQEGSVWITLDKELRDFVVPAGELLRVPRGRHAILQALSVAEVEIQDSNLDYSMPVQESGRSVTVHEEPMSSGPYLDKKAG